MLVTNGHNSNGRSNGHNKQLNLDIELEADDVRLCCVRLGYGSWCFLPDKHQGEHEGAPAEYGPVEARPALWRRHKGQTK